MIVDLSSGMLVLLALLGLVGGIGITAIGPGGVLPTIGLFALTNLSAAQVAGTAIVTHVATGVLGTAAYTRSGQLHQRDTRRTAIMLAVAALAGTPIGILINTLVSKRLFGIVLAVVLAGTAVLVLYRERRPTPALGRHPGTPALVGVGLVVAVAAGIVGIGGPMLTVPLLAAAGVPVLEALAAAQVQSIVIAGVGTFGYLSTGAIDWALAVLVGVPELVGVLVGWKIAHVLPSRRLRFGLVAVLFALAPYLAIHG